MFLTKRTPVKPAARAATAKKKNKGQCRSSACRSSGNREKKITLRGSGVLPPAARTATAKKKRIRGSDFLPRAARAASSIPSENHCPFAFFSALTFRAAFCAAQWRHQAAMLGHLDDLCVLENTWKYHLDSMHMQSIFARKIFQE